VYWSQVRPESNDFLRGIDYFVLVRVEQPDQAVVAEEITFELGFDENDRLQLWGSLDESGKTKFAEVTKRNRATGEMKRMMAIFVRGELISAATINEPITQGRFVINASDSTGAENIFFAIKNN